MKTGLRRASPNVMSPPLLCITKSSDAMPCARRRASMFSRYRETMGRRAALMTVVLARKYSRISGATSDDREMAMSGACARRISPARCSCCALRYECKKQTATDSISAS